MSIFCDSDSYRPVYPEYTSVRLLPPTLPKLLSCQEVASHLHVTKPNGQVSVLKLLFFFFFGCAVPCGILVPWPVIEPGLLAVKAWSPKYWTAREFPLKLLFFLMDFFKNIYLFILVAPGLSCSRRTLSCGMHVRSSSPTRDRTRAPFIGSTESYPLDQRSPSNYFLTHSLVLELFSSVGFWISTAQ